MINIIFPNLNLLIENSKNEYDNILFKAWCLSKDRKNIEALHCIRDFTWTKMPNYPRGVQ